MPILPEASNLSYCPFSIEDILPAIFTDMSIIPERSILSRGTAFESAVRSILPVIEPLTSGSLMGVLSEKLISNGLPASSIWNFSISTVVLSISFPLTKIPALRLMDDIFSGSVG